MAEKEKKNFFKGIVSELKKVVWPTFRQVFNGTIAVVSDLVFEKGNVFFSDKVADLVDKKNSDTGNETGSENGNEDTITPVDDETEDNAND